MRLAETDGKTLLRRHGVALPRGVLLRTGEEPPDAVAQWAGHVLKAQILEGGRGKRGLVRMLEGLGSLAETRRLIVAALGDAAAPLLLEEAVPVDREIYLAVRVDGTRQTLELLVASQGGEQVETTAEVTRIPIDPADRVTADAFPQVTHSGTLAHHGVLFRSRAERLRLGSSSRLRTPAGDGQDALWRLRNLTMLTRPNPKRRISSRPGTTPSGLASSSRLRSRSSRLLA
jgi:succinyl-CoA synthetase beta subunit